MEITSISTFIDYYERIRERTNRIIKVIPPAGMEWSYKPGKFTIADIIRHIASIERNMYAQNVLGHASTYKGCGKEIIGAHENDIEYFNKMHEESISIFKSLKNEDLHRKCKTPAGSEILVWKWLRAMVEHEIHHRAQLYIYLNLLDVSTPPMFGLTEEQLKARNLSQ